MPVPAPSSRTPSAPGSRPGRASGAALGVVPVVARWSPPHWLVCTGAPGQDGGAGGGGGKRNPVRTGVVPPSGTAGHWRGTGTAKVPMLYARDRHCAGTTPVVLIAEELAPSVLAVLGADFEVRHVDGADRAALLPALAEADAVLVRSATQIDAEALAAAPRLQVVARAGIGLDNVDVPAATARGVHGRQRADVQHRQRRGAGRRAAAGLRPQPRPADAALKAGKWERSRSAPASRSPTRPSASSGLGRIGVLFAQRMPPSASRCIAYDPYVQPARAAQIGVRLVSLDELLRESDFISIHLPKTPETLGLIGAEQLALPSRGVRIVNAARGGLVDEAGARRGARGGPGGRRRHRRLRHRAVHRLAAVRVRPASSSRRTSAPRPSRRRTRPAWRSPARSGSRCRASSCPTRSTCRPAASSPRTCARPCRWSRSSAASSPRSPAGSRQSVHVEVRGEIAEYDVAVLQLAALKGVFTDVVEEPVTFVNAPVLAAERGVETSLSTDRESPDYRNLVTRARRAARRHAGVGVGHARRHRARSRSSPRSTASTSTWPPSAPARSSATPTGPASSAGSAHAWARPASTSPARRSAVPSRAVTRSWR